MRFREFVILTFFFFLFIASPQSSLASDTCISQFSDSLPLDTSQQAEIEDILQTYADEDSSTSTKPFRRYDDAKFQYFKNALIRGHLELSLTEQKYPSTELIMALAEASTIRTKGGLPHISEILDGDDSSKKANLMNLIADFRYKLVSQNGFHDDDVFSLIKDLYFLSHPFYIRWAKYLSLKGRLNETAGMRLRKSLLGKNLRSALTDAGIANVDSPIGNFLNESSLKIKAATRASLFFSFFYSTGLPPLFPRPYFTNLIKGVPDEIVELGEKEGFDAALVLLKARMSLASHADWAVAWARILYIGYISAFIAPQFAPQLPLIKQAIEMKFISEKDLEQIQTKVYSPNQVRKLMLDSFADNIRQTENREPTQDEIRTEKHKLEAMPDRAFQLDLDQHK